MDTKMDINIAIEYLKNYNIPINRKYRDDNILLIPNGVIRLKNFKNFKNMTTDVVHFINKIIEILKEHDFHTYIVLTNICSENRFNNFCNIVYQYINSNRITFCNSLEQICVGEFNYATDRTNALHSMISNFQFMYSQIENKIIYVKQKMYNLAIAILTDEELTILHTYNIILVDDIIQNLDNICYITNTNEQYDNSLFKLQFKSTPLSQFVDDISHISNINNISDISNKSDKNHRKPIRIIENVTTLCPNCLRIVYIDDNIIRKHNCFAVNFIK